LFVDADGVLWSDTGPGAILRTKELSAHAHSFLGQVRSATEVKFKVIVVSNQTAVARGMTTEDEMVNLFDQLLLKPRLVDAVLLCLCHPHAQDSRYRTNCRCRKPNPEMFLVAANRLMVDLKESVMIGDRITDIVASSRAGISRNYLLLNDRSFELNFSEDAVGDEDSTYFSVIRELSEVVLATPSEIDKD